MKLKDLVNQVFTRSFSLVGATTLTKNGMRVALWFNLIIIVSLYFRIYKKARTLRKKREHSSMRNRIFYLEKLEPDVTGWQRYFGFDKTGGYVNVDVRINSDEMTITWSSEYATGTHYKTNYFKNTAAKNRKAGPFIDFPENDKTINIDPRVKP